MTNRRNPGFPMIPEAPKDQCEYCVEQGGAFDATCRACVARDVSRMPDAVRRNYYTQACESFSREMVTAFVADVRELRSARNAK